MSFDYGTRNIGVAIGNVLIGSCQALNSLSAKDGIPDWQQVEALLNEWQPDLLVIGLPLNMDGSQSEMSLRANKFANRLHGMFGFAICTIDERLSSAEAKNRAQKQGHKGHYGKNPIDGLAAQIIFEDWYEQNQN